MRSLMGSMAGSTKHTDRKDAKPEEQLARRLGSKLQEHMSLRDVSAFGIGGVADYYFEATSIDELISAVSIAQTLDIPWIVLGTVSQTVVSDIGYAGLVIRNRTHRSQFVPQTGQVLVDSGVEWAELVLAAAAYDLGGCEAMLPMPGTIGGTLVQDCVAMNGFHPRSLLRRVTMLDAEGNIHQVAPDRYFRAGAQSGVVLIATIQLLRTRHDEIMRRIAVYEKERRRIARLSSQWLGPVFSSEFSQADPSYLPLEFERAKVLGRRVGGAVFSNSRPNYIEARGRVTSADVRELVTQIYHRLSETMTEPPQVKITFVGSW